MVFNYSCQYVSIVAATWFGYIDQAKSLIICSLRIAYMIILASVWPVVHFRLWYLLTFVNSSWSLLVFYGMCWSLFVFVGIWLYLLRFVDSCCYLIIVVHFARQSHWCICSLRIAYMINLASVWPVVHFRLRYLLTVFNISW